VLAAAIALLYLAREDVQRLLRAAFLFVAHSLRLLDRWIRAGADAAMARHDHLGRAARGRIAIAHRR
jgi:hypothetical protein